MNKRRIKSGLISVLVFIIIMTLIFSPSVFASSGMPVFESDEGVYLMDPDTGDLYAKQNEKSRYYPASTTKLLTALTAMDEISNSLDERVIIGKEVTMIDADSSVANLIEGDSYSWKDLLYGLLLPSGNDAAMTIAVNVARHHSGNQALSESDAIALFSEMMNKKAVESGATDSHFINPHGLYDDHHYTTPEDMVHIAQKAFENQTIRDICQTTQYLCYSDGGKVHEWQNSNILIQNSSEKFSTQTKEKLQITDSTNPYYCSYATEGKTGYDDLAGRCLVFTGKNDEMKMIGVIYKASDMMSIYSQAKTALESALNDYSHVEIKEAYSKAWVLGSGLFNGMRVSLLPRNNNVLTIPTDEKDYLMISIEWDEKYFTDKGAFLKIEASFEEGEQVATLHIMGDTYENQIPLYAENGMRVFGGIDFLLVGLGTILIAFLIFYCVIQVKYRKIRRKENQQRKMKKSNRRF